ncbi:IS3 family transposase [Paenibacillus lautus]|uniref:IS3 family transposase n=1 Tax=Paenibacillus TaxID=44249 RepID=UPI00117D6AB1
MRTAKGIHRLRTVSSVVEPGERHAKKVFGNLDAGGKEERFKLIEQAAEIRRITELCQHFGVSRSGYYAYLKWKKNDRDAEAKRLIRTVYKRYEGKYGYRQLQLFLRQDDRVWMNHKKVLRLMQKLGIQASIRQKRRFKIPGSRACCGESA